MSIDRLFQSPPKNTRPVDGNDAPDYYEHIKYPMDLKTMSERLKSKYYINERLFIANMQRIFNNCRAYNGSDTEYYKLANNLECFFIGKMKEINIWENRDNSLEIVKKSPF